MTCVMTWVGLLERFIFNNDLYFKIFWSILLPAYSLDESFFSKLPVQKIFIGFEGMIEATIRQLVTKYEIKNKNIFSIGSGLAFEEYWFYKFGNNLVLLDIDEPKILEKVCIDSMNSNGNITYIIDDVYNFDNYDVRKFDVVYVSSFTLNELRNAEIAGKNSIVNRGLNQILKKVGKYKMKKWPQSKAPFMDIIMKILNQTLKTGGLFICQSYASDVDSSSSSYIEAVKKQLNSNGIKLFAIYRFTEYRSVHLIVGFKGDESSARKFAQKIKSHPEITDFHGRAELDHTIIKQFSIWFLFLFKVSKWFSEIGIKYDLLESFKKPRFVIEISFFRIGVLD